MNASIAELLKLRIQQFSYVEKLGGIVRAVSFERQGGRITIPVGSGVEDPLQCGDNELLDLVPDERYKCIVFFEDRGLVPVVSRTRGQSWTSNLRLVCWVNTAKLGGDANAADAVLQQFLGVLNSGPYNLDPFIGIRHRLSGVASKGPSIFAAYTFPDAARQYLLWPFDAFAIDIATEFRIRPGCEPVVSGSDVTCWTPPSTYRRRHPREFSCEELNDPTNGLTLQQKLDCLDCDPGGPCADANVLRDGLPYGTVASGGTIDVPSDCPICPECPECLAGHVLNSDSTYDQYVLSGGTLNLPDVDHTDSDGSTLTLPAMTPFVATLCPPPCVGVDIFDFDGTTLLAHVNDGDSYTIMPTILPYTDRAAALADSTTIANTQQMVHILDSGRMYPGTGETVDKIVDTGRIFLLPVRDNMDGVLTTTLEDGTLAKIQINE
jgi:hypothetical protein